MDPTQADESAPPAGAAEETCPTCGAAAVPNAVFCRSCGERLAAEPPPPAAEQLPPPLPPPRPNEPRRAGSGRRAAGAVLACLLLGAAVAGGAYLLTKDDDGAGKPAGSPFEEPFSDLGADAKAGSATVRENAKPQNTESTEPEDVPIVEPEDAGGFSQLIAGRYVQAGSFLSPAGAEREVDRLVGEGIDVEAVPADEADELLPGLQVLLAGPLAGDEEEERVLEQLEDAGVSGFGRDLTPSRTLSGPGSIAGEWEGSFEETHLRGSRRSKTYDVVFSIDSDGETGSVDYPDQECGGTLELLEGGDYSSAYREWIEYGDCIDEGTWHLRPDGAQLTGVWLHDDYELMVNGSASPR